MTKKLHISDDLSLPLDFVTQTQAILAKRGVGKSYTASVEAEELLKAGQQVVVIDPTGAWFGLKSSADGKSAGFPIAVFGGEHADVPLEESAGEIVAQAIIERRFSAIIDLSFLRKNQRNRFMTAFLETLFRLNRVAMHLFVDEAHTIAPQKPFGEEARMLGAIEDVVMLGRRRGLGCTLITQRPQVLNKNVLTQCEILCCLRLLHPKDIDAVEEWVNVHADAIEAKTMIDSLPALPIGTAWFWAPGWGDIFKRVKIRKRETFDSSATPKAGEAQVTPKVLAPIDIEKLGQQITATVERAKENDPAQLKRKIAELQKQVAGHKPVAVAAPVIEQKIVEVPILKPEEIKLLSDIVAELGELSSALSGAASDVKQAIQAAIQKRAAVAPVRQAISRATQMSRPAVARVTRAAESNGDLNGDLRGPERKILRTLAELRAIGRDTPSREMVAAWASYSPNGSAFTNPLGALRTRGFVDYPQPGAVRLMEDGERLVGTVEPPDADELRRRIETTCTGPEQKILKALLNHAGQGEMSREELAEKSDYSPNGSAFTNPLGALRTKGLLDYPRAGFVKAADWLFIGEAA